MAESCWINASNKTDLPGRSGIYWFCYCVINIKVEPGCSRIISEISQMNLSTERLRQKQHRCWFDAEMLIINDGKVQKSATVLRVKLRLLLRESGRHASPPASLYRTSYPGEQRQLDMQGSRNAACCVERWPKFLGAPRIPGFSTNVSPNTVTPTIAPPLLYDAARLYGL